MILDPSPASIHRILEGFASEATGHGDWDVRWDFVTEGEPSELPVLWAWKPHLVVCAVAKAIRAAMSLGCPVIGLGPVQAGERVVIDEVAIGRLAADHLLERGLRRLACFSNAIAGIGWWPLRTQGYIRRARSSAVDPSVLPGPPAADATWADGFAAWVQSDPSPVGVFAGNDHFARFVAQACWDRDIAVPDRVAIIGADDDPWHCQLATTALSSVAVPHRALGIEAARLVVQRLAAPQAQPREVLLAPDGVVVRRSTDVSSVQDALVREVVRFIDAHLGDTLRIDGLARHLGCSRRTLELRVRKATGESVLVLIQRARIRRAEVALRDERRTILHIALDCGFTSPGRFAAVFRGITGLAPAAYRERLARGA